MTTLEQSHHPTQHPSLMMQQPEPAKNVHVYLNGDKFFTGRKFVVNKKHISDFDGFLNEVSSRIKAPFGAVRNVYTPTSGHRVNDLQQIRSGMQLVAGGVERFRKLEYNSIASKKRPLPRRNYLDIKLHNHRMNVSARWRKYVKDPCQIYVYGNGDINAPAVRLLLIPRCMKTWDLVLGEITEKISLRTGQAVRKLYDMNYRLLADPSELENGQYYVAVGTEKLKKFPYGEMHKPHALPHSPKKTNLQPLPPIRKPHKPIKPSPREEGEQSYSRLYAHRKQMREQQEETTIMGASAATGYRPLKMKKFKPQRPPGGHPAQESDTVFHAKPVKVKRASGRGVVVHDLHPPSEESDGVFRTNSNGIKAEEVDEDEDIKVDLPIDQVPADEVDEEEIPSARNVPVSDDEHSSHEEPVIEKEDALVAVLVSNEVANEVVTEVANDVSNEEAAEEELIVDDHHSHASKEEETEEMHSVHEEAAENQTEEVTNSVAAPSVTPSSENKANKMKSKGKLHSPNLRKDLKLKQKTSHRLSSVKELDDEALKTPLPEEVPSRVDEKPIDNAEEDFQTEEVNVSHSNASQNENEEISSVPQEVNPNEEDPVAKEEEPEEISADDTVTTTIIDEGANALPASEENDREDALSVSPGNDASNGKQTEDFAEDEDGGDRLDNEGEISNSPNGPSGDEESAEVKEKEEMESSQSPKPEDTPIDQINDPDQDAQVAGESVSILNGVDKISVNSNDNQVSPNHMEGDTAYSVDDQEILGTESNPVEEESTERASIHSSSPQPTDEIVVAASITPSSPQQREDKLTVTPSPALTPSSPQRSEEETVEPAVVIPPSPKPLDQSSEEQPTVEETEPPISPRSEADGADVSSRDTVTKSVEDDTVNADGSLEKEESNDPSGDPAGGEEEEKTARPVSEALTEPSDDAPPAPASPPVTPAKQRLSNGSAKAAGEVTNAKSKLSGKKS